MIDISNTQYLMDLTADATASSTRYDLDNVRRSFAVEAANTPVRLRRCTVYPLEQFYNDANVSQVSLVVSRSIANDRRGTKPRNLYAVVAYDRRVRDRRL